MDEGAQVGLLFSSSRSSAIDYLQHSLASLSWSSAWLFGCALICWSPNTLPCTLWARKSNPFQSSTAQSQTKP